MILEPVGIAVTCHLGDDSKGQARVNVYFLVWWNGKMELPNAEMGKHDLDLEDHMGIKFGSH